MWARWAIAGGVSLWLAASSALGGESSAVQFARDVRPLLSENCYHCHGPDEESRQADLRLDQQDGLFARCESGVIVKAGNPEQSRLFQRISADGADRMPPPDLGLRLTTDEVEKIRTWIAEGAQWQPHWSFVPPERPALPRVERSYWARNPIDRFILARLEEQGQAPSPEADKETLIRRVSLDLTGLPPTLQEIDDFLADDAPDAYERLVDRLLASPRYGERMASLWLDAARYADTYGYQDDGELSMWRWRDWVIEAFNQNMPFDQFTIEQLAGDLLPGATVEQQLATGFNRNHRHNAEGGIIPEEFRVEYVADRVETMATVWMGLTATCARCHDHKYDPITQREYYQLFAFFNNVPEDGRAYRKGNTPPLVAAPTRQQHQKWLRLEARLARARESWKLLGPAVESAQAEWERGMTGDAVDEFTVTQDLDARFRFDGELIKETGKTQPEELVIRNGSATYRKGKFGKALDLDGQRYLEAGEEIGSFSDDNTFSFSAWIRPAKLDGTILSRLESDDDPKSEGYTLMLRDGHVRLQLVSQWVDDSIRAETQIRIPLNTWSHIATSYDGKRSAEGLHIYINGQAQPLDLEMDSLYSGFANDGPVRIGKGGGAQNTFCGNIDDLRIYDKAISDDEAKILALPNTLDRVLQTPHAQRTPLETQVLRMYFLDQHAPPEIRAARTRVRRLEGEVATLEEEFPTVMVMAERAERRLTYLLTRGQYDAPADEVTPDVPAVLPPIESDMTRDRLGLARWLVDPKHPLTARVTVNRLWQMSFGVGLVDSAEDFGAQGDLPTHPRLLDWLATEFLDEGWDVKALRRLIVTSSTYRQASRATDELLAIDPQNRLLARGPRFRLPAEAVRDQALLASGLLVEQVGGPPVRIYQPPGLWAELSDATYKPDEGEGRYRRSLYAYWKRTIPHPLMMTFDSADRETCRVREGRTNTPLQALALLNEAGFVEAAQALARRALREAGVQPANRLNWLFRMATGRRPAEMEQQVLHTSFARHREHFTNHPSEATDLVSSPADDLSEQAGIADLAAYTAVANTLLNLDEVVVQH